MRTLILLAALSIAAPAAAQVTVTDGDTLKVDGTTFRLWGIDAPETKQWCGTYPAGAQAGVTLQKLVKGKTVTCEDRGRDRYGRTIGLCRADGVDLGKEMVLHGMAWAFTRYSIDYVAVEEQARRENIGVHSWNCEKPWEWRARQRQ